MYKYILLLALTSCVHHNSNMPMVDEFYSIYKEEYILDKNDCTNKSAKYARILRENGYDAHMMILYNNDGKK